MIPRNRNSEHKPRFRRFHHVYRCDYCVQGLTQENVAYDPRLSTSAKQNHIFWITQKAPPQVNR